MNPLRNFISGQCMTMCPPEEIKMRERERLLHVLEMLPGTENDRMPKADVNRMVKSFCRSAVGNTMQEPKNLRPPAVLLETISYLFDDVISRTDVPWTTIYDFLMDRLRSIRQDMIIQNISRAHYISCLQPIVRFYAYASYRSETVTKHLRWLEAEIPFGVPDPVRVFLLTRPLEFHSDPSCELGVNITRSGHCQPFYTEKEISVNCTKDLYVTTVLPLYAYYAHTGKTVVHVGGDLDLSNRAENWLCEENINTFDPFLNNTHLQECLKRLLCTYDDYDELDNKVSTDVFHDFLIENRPYFEALYIILNIGNPTAITRCLNLSRKWRTDLVENALELSLCYTNCNFVRACRTINILPKLLSAVASLHLPELRRKAFKVMSVAYSSKNLTYPVCVLRKLLLYDTDCQIINDCKYYGLEIRDNGICFSKNSFDERKVAVSPMHQKFVDQNLIDANLSNLVLFGD